LNLRPPRPERDSRHLSPCNYLQDSAGKTGTPQEHPAIAVPYLCQQFEDWLDRHTLTPEAAEAANLVLRFLRMPVVPRPLLEAFAEAVRGLPHIQCTEPVVIVSSSQSDRRQNRADQGVSRPGRPSDGVADAMG
jgi:hypothetical protein